MQRLVAGDILELWLEGQGLHAVDRALLTLHQGCPEYSHEALAELSLGQRDALLLELHALTFGDRLDACVECPECGERLEFSTSCRALRVESSEPAGPRTLAIDGLDVRLRPLNSRDLAATVPIATVEEARRIWVRRCAAPVGMSSEVELEALPDAVQREIADRLLALDPQAEVLFDLRCPACSHGWQNAFDIVSFLWIEVQTQAQRISREVDALARTYGWAEKDILDMSDGRRRLYLHMASS
jgi:hypothetical protein